MIIQLSQLPATYLTCCKTIETRRAPLIAALHQASINSPTEINGRITEPYSVGVAEGHIKALIKCRPPFVIFEDDARILRVPTPTTFIVPENADALYLGTSSYARWKGATHQGLVATSEIGSDYFRVYNMLGLHAIVYISQQYVEHVTDRLLSYIANPRGACDDVVADSMHEFNVLCLKKPIFYQDDGKANVCTSESLTPTFVSH